MISYQMIGWGSTVILIFMNGFLCRFILDGMQESTSLSSSTSSSSNDPNVTYLNPGHRNSAPGFVSSDDLDGAGGGAGGHSNGLHHPSQQLPDNVGLTHQQQMM